MLFKKTWLLILGQMLFAGYAFGQSAYSPEKEALKLFKRYKPVIEKKNNGIVDGEKVYTGDLNGDGLPDCVLSFVITPKDGGNAIIGTEYVIYLNTGTGMKVAGAFPVFKFCFGIDHIKDGFIYIKQYECAPPYDTFLKDSKLAYKNGKVVEVK